MARLAGLGGVFVVFRVAVVELARQGVILAAAGAALTLGLPMALCVSKAEAVIWGEDCVA